jgi:hypothetical protein
MHPRGTCAEQLAGAEDARADRADRDVESVGGLFVGQLAPDDEQQCFAIPAVKAPQRADKRWVKPRIDLGWQMFPRCLSGQALDGAQAPAFAAASLGDHVGGDAEQPGQ